MKNAIEKSVEGGYIPKNPSGKGFKFTFGDTSEVVLNPHSFLLDPLFWKCLGKSFGWDEVNGKRWESEKFGFMPVWKHHWHSFIDHLASDGDAESFFKNLLNQN